MARMPIYFMSTGANFRKDCRDMISISYTYNETLVKCPIHTDICVFITTVVKVRVIIAFTFLFL